MKYKSIRSNFWHSLNEIFGEKYYRLWPTSDDWAPNFPNDNVQIRIGIIPLDLVNKFFIRIVVSGEDDTYLEKDYEYDFTPAAVLQAKKRINFIC